MPPLIYLLDLLGTFAFAITGAYAALRKEFDIFGIFIAAFLTSLAGGTIRELLLGGVPPYFHDNNYLLAVLLGILFAVVFYSALPRLRSYIVVVDAIGLSTFAFIGAASAAAAGLGFFPIVLLATLTAAGGGVVRDIALRETPQIFYSDFYASPAILLGIVYSLSPQTFSHGAPAYLLILSIFILRLLAVRFNIGLWRPHASGARHE